MTFTIILEPGQDGSWAALVPDLPGLVVVAESREAVIALAPDAIADYLDSLRASGTPLPVPKTVAVQVEVPAA